MSATIIEIQSENIKRIKAVKIVPTGSTVVVTGKNDQGKSSVLDSIDYAFRGADAICDEPLRQGEKRGTIRLKLSEELAGVCTIERKFTPSGTVLEVKNAEGVPQKSPQALLDTIISKVTFDPLSFVRMKPAEQTETLRKLAGLDFTQINADRKRAFEERTVRNRELESAKTRLNSFPFDPSAPKEPVSTAQLAEKLSQCQSHNEGNRQKQIALDRLKAGSAKLAADDAQLRSEIKRLEEMLAEKVAALQANITAHQNAILEIQLAEKEIATLSNLDETDVRKQIADIESINAKVAANKRHELALADISRIESDVNALTQAIQDLDAEKAAQIEFAEFPMPGLSFDEDRGPLLNGVPFSQSSSARQLQAAVNIGLALNPKIKVILIRDGSLLDDESMKLVSEAVAAKGGQLWVEVVNSKDPSAIVIEDGEVKP